jgi:hypothetical protein
MTNIIKMPQSSRNWPVVLNNQEMCNWFPSKIIHYS